MNQKFEAFRRQLTKGRHATRTQRVVRRRAAMDTQFDDCLIDLKNFTNGLDRRWPADSSAGRAEASAATTTAS